MPTPDERAATSQTLAYWFLRLNGFLTIANFILHRDRDDVTASGMRTDADILGVRFPHRDEQGMKDFFSNDKPLLLIVEIVSSGECKVNGSWSDQDRKNVHRLLSAIGIIKDDLIETAADAIYTACCYEDFACSIRYAAMGMMRIRPRKKIPQLEADNVA